MRDVMSKLSAILVVILFFSASLLAQDQTGQEDQTDQTQTEQEAQTGQQDQTTGQDQTGQDQTGKQDETTTKQDQTTGENQQFESAAQQLTDNLATKITLTDEQKTEIKDAVAEYYGRVIPAPESSETGEMQGQEGTKKESETTKKESETTKKESETTTETADVEEADQWLNDKIAGVLEESQMAQWDVAKADFWNQLRDNVATMQQGTGTGQY